MHELQFSTTIAADATPILKTTSALVKGVPSWKATPMAACSPTASWTTPRPDRHGGVAVLEWHQGELYPQGRAPAYALSCRVFRQLFALACDLANFLRTLALPDAVTQWSLPTLRETLVKVGARLVRHGRYVTFQLPRWRCRGRC